MVITTSLMWPLILYLPAVQLQRYMSGVALAEVQTLAPPRPLQCHTERYTTDEDGVNKHLSPRSAPTLDSWRPHMTDTESLFQSLGMISELDPPVLSSPLCFCHADGI